MSRNTVFLLLLGLAMVVGTVCDRPAQRPVVVAGGYRILSADFHIHSSFGSDGTLTPLGLVLEAQRQGLDAIAITGHNNVVESKIGRWLGRWPGGVTVLGGEEVVAPRFHMIAVGIDQPVDFRQSAADAIDAVHQQGGIAIAAHPGPQYSPGFSDLAVAKLDGAEICHPMVYGRQQAQGDLETFAVRAHMAAIGSSDYHGLGRIGSCRTFVFAHDNTEAAIVEALRAHRTVTFGVGNKAYGEPEFVGLAEAAGVRQRLPKNDRGSGADWLSRIAGVIGLGSLVLGQKRSD